jgi:hypothetical protein
LVARRVCRATKNHWSKGGDERGGRRRYGATKWETRITIIEYTNRDMRITIREHKNDEMGNENYNIYLRKR